MCGKVAKLGFSGFEFLEGIPGTLGGALRMNAGAMGRWTFDVVERVLMVNSTSKVEEMIYTQTGSECLYRLLKLPIQYRIIYYILSISIYNITI